MNQNVSLLLNVTVNIVSISKATSHQSLGSSATMGFDLYGKLVVTRI